MHDSIRPRHFRSIGRVIRELKPSEDVAHELAIALKAELLSSQALAFTTGV